MVYKKLYINARNDWDWKFENLVYLHFTKYVASQSISTIQLAGSQKMSLIKQAIPSTVKNARIGVIGAGISGLTFSYFLAKLHPDWSIKVYEQSKRPGGYILSQPTKVGDAKSTILEKGPRTLRGVSQGTLILLDLLDKFKLRSTIKGVHANAAANKKYLLSKSGGFHIVQVPDDSKTTLKFVLDGIGRSIPSAIGREMFTMKKAQKEETVDEFVTRHFGKKMWRNLFSAIMNGIYAADGTQLSVKAVMPKLVDIESKNASICRYMFGKSVFGKKKTSEKEPQISPYLQLYEKEFQPRLNLLKMSQYLRNFPMTLLSGGLETLPKAIYANMPPNVEFKFGSKVSDIKPLPNGKISLKNNSAEEQFDHVRSTINVQALSHMLKSPDFAKLVSPLKYTTVTLANVYVPNQNVLPKTGFGFLVPNASADEDKLLGVIFDSDVEHSAKPIFASEKITSVLESDKPVEKKQLDELAGKILKADPPIKDPYTKVTFMIGGAKYDKVAKLPSENEIKQIVLRKMDEVLGVNLGDDARIEVGFVKNAIPQYNVGYLDLKAKAWKLAENEFNGNLSFGGMTFADGVGVPDCVMSSFKDALRLSGRDNL